MKNVILLVVALLCGACGGLVETNDEGVGGFGGAGAPEPAPTPIDITTPSGSEMDLPDEPSPYNQVTSEMSGYQYSGVRGIYGYVLHGTYYVEFQVPAGWREHCRIVVDGAEHDLQTGDVFQDSTLVIWGCTFSVTFEELE